MKQIVIQFETAHGPLDLTFNDAECDTLEIDQWGVTYPSSGGYIRIPWSRIYQIYETVDR